MEIRPAHRDDRGAIAELMYSAGPELYDFLYRTDRVAATAFIADEFASGRGFCGYRNLTVAVIDGEVVATGCFYDGRQYGALMRGTVLNALRYFRLREVLPLLLRSGHVDSVMTHPARDELYLANFGVAPSRRGQGIGEAMVRHQLAQARARGYRVFSLDVAVTNPRAEALYRRLGLHVVREKHFSGHRPGIRVPDARKMELALV
ncbi:MAG: GNAT family N-acetyltransferase [Pseudomonadota bacterium]